MPDFPDNYHMCCYCLYPNEQVSPNGSSRCKANAIRQIEHRIAARNVQLSELEHMMRELKMLKHNDITRLCAEYRNFHPDDGFTVRDGLLTFKDRQQIQAPNGANTQVVGRTGG